MKAGLRNLLWIIPLGLALSLPLWREQAAAFLKPRGGYDAAAERAYSEDSRNFVMDDVILFFSTRGQLTWTVKSKQARTGATDREIDMVGVDAVYSKEDDEPMTVVSRKGKYKMDDQHLILTDDVVVTKPLRQEIMRSDLLHYYDKSHLLVSPTDVKISSPSLQLKAGEMQYDISTKAYQFGQRVHVLM